MIDPEMVLGAHLPGEDPGPALVAADWFLERGERELAASALDRAYGLCPDDAGLAARRKRLLEELAVVEHGLVWRYVPAGTFRMGSDDGDPDERPVHPVRLGAYHVAEVPTTWAAFCHLMGWEPPPRGFPREDLDRDRAFPIAEANKIRLQYCETGTVGAHDWHAHAPHLAWQRGGEEFDPAELFGRPRRDDPDRPWSYDRKPMVGVRHAEAEALAARMSGGGVTYRLPSEAEWEKAARGGSIGAPWPWGHEPPTPERCDFGHMGEYVIRDPRTMPPNGYGVYGMSGGVWEWTSSPYWAPSYAAARDGAPDRPAELPERALRGGSWADDAYAVRLSFRMSRSGVPGPYGWHDALSPTIGFRLVRVAG